MKYLIQSLEKARFINEVLLIFSHDFSSASINQLVKEIRFCRVNPIDYFLVYFSPTTRIMQKLSSMFHMFFFLSLQAFGTSVFFSCRLCKSSIPIIFNYFQIYILGNIRKIALKESQRKSKCCFYLEILKDHNHPEDMSSSFGFYSHLFVSVFFTQLFFSVLYLYYFLVTNKLSFLKKCIILL